MTDRPTDPDTTAAPDAFDEKARTALTTFKLALVEAMADTTEHDRRRDKVATFVDAATSWERLQSAVATYELGGTVLGMLTASVDDGAPRNFVKIEVGGTRFPFDRAEVTLMRPGGKTPHDLLVEEQAAGRRLSFRNAALETQIERARAENAKLKADNTRFILANADVAMMYASLVCGGGQLLTDNDDWTKAARAFESTVQVLREAMVRREDIINTVVEELRALVDRYANGGDAQSPARPLVREIEAALAKAIAASGAERVAIVADLRARLDAWNRYHDRVRAAHGGFDPYTAAHDAAPATEEPAS